MNEDPDKFEERLVIVADTFAKLISQAPYLQGVPVLTERNGDIQATIAQKLALLGLSVVVVAPDGDSLERTGDGLRLRVRIVAQISELFLINQGATGTKKPALAAATVVMKAVDRMPNGLDVGSHIPGLNEFLLQEEQPFKLTKDPKYVAYQVTAFTTVEL